MSIENLPSYTGPSPYGIGNTTGDTKTPIPSWVCTECHITFPGSTIPTQVKVGGEIKKYCSNCGVIAAIQKGDRE